MCASVRAAFSTIVCQLGVFERDLLSSQSYSEPEQVCKSKKWFMTKGTSKETRGCFLMTSQEVIGDSLSHKHDMISS